MLTVEREWKLKEKVEEAVKGRYLKAVESKRNERKKDHSRNCIICNSNSTRKYEGGEGGRGEGKICEISKVGRERKR